MKRYIFTALFLSQISFSQNLPAEQVIANFNQNQVEWAIPLPKNKQIPVTWYERKTSLSSEGIRTFAGYANDDFLGVISIHKNQLSGNISWKGENYIIATQKGKITITKDKQEGSCGVCADGSCHSHSHETLSKPRTLALEIGKIDDIPEIYTDGVLRVYRLAILMDYSLYTNLRLDENRVKQFWAETETFLNELYTRDLSIKFEIVQDDRLIRKTIQEQVFTISTTPNTITDEATKKINGIIGENAYDVGVVASYGGTGLNGIAGLFSAYEQHTKANAWVSVLRPATVAHELGHLFGASHTYSTGGAQDSMNTEPRRGQSVMSYNHDLPRDFFSLPSVNIIRKAIQNNADYYTNTERTHRVGPQNSGNIIYGIASNNQAPIINRSQLKSEYTLPQGSYFQFHIPATDPDGHSLRYMAHQADIRLKERTGFAIVRSAKAQSSPTVVFYPQYYITDRNTVSQIEASAPTYPISGNNNERTFWLGVSDAGELIKNQNHAVRYDMFPTKVKFVNGTAFRILRGEKSSYNAGEKITLTWGVDRSVFGTDSKVRISMSDDFGQSWKYVLVPETANDGSEEITIPHIELGRKEHATGISSGLGLIKVEVIGHIAVAISNHHPSAGGFEIKKSAISFENLPEPFISVKAGQEPQKANVTASTTCNTSINPLEVQFNETKTESLITRTWTTSDNCNNTATFTQQIEVKKAVQPLRFVGELPKDIHIACPKDMVEAPAELQVEGGTNPTVTFTQTKIEGDYDNHTLKRTWIATDPDAEPIMHTQIVVVNDGVKPVLSAYPPSMTVRSNEEMPQNPTITATDNCDGNVFVDFTSYLDTVDGKQVFVNSWTATDKSGNQTHHTQRITIDPNYVEPTTIPLAWVESSLPPAHITVSCNQIPTPQNPATTGGKGMVKITHSDSTKGQCDYTFTRTYTATDGTDTLTYQQMITVEDTEKPRFNEILPTDRTIQQGEDIPEQVDLTASDNCSTEVVVEKSVERVYASSPSVSKQFEKLQKESGLIRYIGTTNSENRPNFYTSFESALNVANEGDTLVLLNDMETSRLGYKQDADGRVEALTLKSLTIDGNGHKLHIPVRPLSLAGDVLFKNINLSLQPLLSLDDSFGSLGGGGVVESFQYIYLNGNSLTFDKVNTKVEGQNVRTRPVIVMGAEKGRTDAGQAQFIVKNADKTAGETQIKNIIAGSLDFDKTTDSYIELGEGTRVLEDIFFQREKTMSGKIILLNRSTQVLNINASNTKNEVILENVNYGFRTPTLQGIENLTLKGNTNLTQKDLNISGRLTLSEDSSMEVTAGIFGDEDIFFSVGSITSHNASLKLGDTVEFTLQGDIEGTLNVITDLSPESFQKGENSNAQVTPTENGFTISGNTVQELEKVIYTWTATDSCGNRVEHTQTITINPRKIPLAWVGTLPAENISVSCNAVPTAQTLMTNKGEEITATETRQNGNCPNSYTLTRTWTSNSDNERISHTQTITVEDKTAPTWNNANHLPQNLVIEEGQNIPVQVELTASDNCGVATVTKSESRENGKVIYTWTATDVCGNRVEHTQTITINPKPIAPITWISQLPQNVRVSCAGNVPNAENLTATGGQGLLRITHNDVRSAETCANKYVITRTYTATDGVRSIQYTQTIEVNDDIAPSFVGDLPQNITIEEGQNVPVQVELTATDNCGVANVETSEREVLENGKLKQKIYTWVAKDVCGNQIQHEQIIEIKEKKVEVPNKLSKPKLYPNPTNDSFQLSIENVKGVKVYNTAGRLVKTFEPQQKYDISNLTSEVYIIAVETEKGMEYIKLIKR